MKTRRMTMWLAVLALAGCAGLGGMRAEKPSEGERNGFKPGRVYCGDEPDVKAFGIRTDLDLRNAQECSDPDRSPLGVSLVRASVRPYADLFDKRNRRAWTDAIRLFSDSRNYPIYIHCCGEAVRTGTLVLLLEGLCGVEGADSREVRRVREQAPGMPFKAQVAAFLKKEFGITDAEIAAIRANLTEENPKTPVPTVLAEFRKTEEHPRNSEGDVIELKDGRLLVVYSHFYKDAASKFADGGSDSSSAELVLTESADGGKTWSPMRTIVRKEEGTLNVMSASFLRLGDGRLAIFYLAKNTETECLPTMIVSSDEGKTWSKASCCISEKEKGYYVLNNARACRLAKTGRILLPLACHHIGGKSYSHGAVLSCAISDDDGKTWRMSADRRRGPEATNGVAQVCLQEPGLIGLGDGRLMMYARSNERRQWRLYSTDGGDHWTQPEPVTEYSTTTYSPVTYARLGDGRLVVVYNDAVGHSGKPVAYERRWPLSVGVSSDEGKTWKTKLLEPDDPSVAVHACYIALREIAGRLVLVYCYCDALATTRVVSIPPDWLPGVTNLDSIPN